MYSINMQCFTVYRLKNWFKKIMTPKLFVRAGWDQFLKSLLNVRHIIKIFQIFSATPSGPHIIKPTQKNKFMKIKNIPWEVSQNYIDNKKSKNYALQHRHSESAVTWVAWPSKSKVKVDRKIKCTEMARNISRNLPGPIP